MPQCLDLTEDHSFHEEDFSIDCNSGSYLLSLTLTAVAILFIPIGVPFTFMFLMTRSKANLGGVNQTALGGAKLVPDDVDDDEDPFGYLCKDCKPDFYYCEYASTQPQIVIPMSDRLPPRFTLHHRRDRDLQSQAHPRRSLDLYRAR